MRLLIATLMLWASAGYAIDGDLDKNGVVDFADFFIFADNFGLTGEVETSDCGTPLITGIIPDLAYINITGAWAANWDGDIEDDGVLVGLHFNDDFNDLIFFSRSDNIAIDANVKFFVSATDDKWDESIEKKYDDPFGEVDFVMQEWDHFIRMPFETYTENVDATDIKTYESVEQVLTLIEVRLTFSDGSQSASVAKEYVVLGN